MWVLIAGVLLIALELATGSFYILWYGIGLAIAGAVGWAIGDEHWIYQTAIGLAIGLALMIVLRPRFMTRRAREPRDEFLLEEGEGTIKENDLVEFRGTLWQYDGEGEFAIGEKVLVRPAANNRVVVRKK